MAVVSAHDNETVIMDEAKGDILADEALPQDIYVSNDGDDNEGNGSLESPFSSIQRAVSFANNNSKIILDEGVYSGDLNTKIVVDKSLTIESGSEATIDGENKNFFFKINSGSSLILNNLKFINGYTNSFSQLGVINNQGNLIVNASSFNKMYGLMSTFFNEGNLIIDNTVVSDSRSENMAQIVTNIGTCTISNSKFTDSKNDDLNTVYNYNNIKIINSRLNSLITNNEYDTLNYKSEFILIQNSTLAYVELENSTCSISNSNFNGRFVLRQMNAVVESSRFSTTSIYSPVLITGSNFTAAHSTFYSGISTAQSDINITYSAILSSLSGSGVGGSLYAPYNWWGINSGPTFEYFKNNYVKYWAIATFEVEDGNLSVGTHSKFITSLNKWSDGNSTYEFKQDECLPDLTVSFEAQNGKFLYSNGMLNNEFYNYLIGNTLDCTVYSIINNQRLSLTIGNGLSAYSYFVAPWGNDGPEDGSLESPYASLQYAVEQAGNGNTICLLEGNYTNIINSNVEITKNITVVGLGDVTLARANAVSIFKIKEWGNLIVKGIRFTADTREYSDSIFMVSGGNLTISDCTFEDISTDAVIYTSSGVENRGQVFIYDSHFLNIAGSVATGVSMFYVERCTFEKISNFYYRSGLENYNAIFSITGSIEIYDSTFDSNTMGAITLHPYTYSSSSLLAARYSEYYKEYSRYAYIVNTTFSNNHFEGLGSYSSIGIGLDIRDNYGTFNGFIANSTFINNVGRIALANRVSGSSFFNNTGHGYYTDALVRAYSIENSLFINNSNCHVSGDSYVGEGISSADTILNSTFINNTASFGGAVANTKEIHYCVFVNNTAKYKGNDIYSNSGDVDYSTNWWGDNQKPNSDKIFIFLGNLRLNDWIIMSLESLSVTTVKASLNTVRDDVGNLRKLSFSIPVRPVHFMNDGGNITPEFTSLSQNEAYANMTLDLSGEDFKVYAQIDNQLLDVDVRNTYTRIIMDDVVVKGNNNNYEMDLINVNGHKISNQTLTVMITDENNKTQTFDVLTNDNGHASFSIGYPVGKYVVNVSYGGDGYFEESDASAIIEILVAKTSIVSYNYTYYGKNNLFYGMLKDENWDNLINHTLTFKIYGVDGKFKSISTKTDMYGRGEVRLSLDVGEYDILVEFGGDSWYENSSSLSHITVNPANSTIIAPNVTLYGMGNLYNITLKDVYGNLMPDENIAVAITSNGSTDNFILTTDDRGVARLTVNYLPGSYAVKASYAGDKIYGPANANALIVVEKVLTVVSGFHYSTIPLNGIYTVVLSDMYGRRINNESITLNCYQGKLIKSYARNTDANGEASFVIDLDEGTYLATMDYGGNIFYDDATGAATIVVSKQAQLGSVSMNASDMIQYYGENKFFIIEFNDPNAYSQYGKEISIAISSGSWSNAYKATTDIFGLARLEINLNPGEYNISYKYSNDYYNIFGNGTNRISVYKMPVTLLANNMVMNVGETRVFSVVVQDINSNPVKNMQVHININGREYDVVSGDDGIARLPLELDIGEYSLIYSISNPNYIYTEDSSSVLVVDSNKTSSQLVTSDISVFDNETINFNVSLNDVLGNGIAYSHIGLEVSSANGEVVKKLTGITDASGRYVFSFNLDYGEYISNVTYEGSSSYLQSGALNKINVKSTDNRTKTYIYVGEVQISSDDRFYIILHDENGTFLSNKEVSFVIKNESHSAKTDAEGKAYLDLSLSDVYAVSIHFDGDENYKPASNQVKVYVSTLMTKIHAFELTKYYRNGTQFHALLTNALGNPLINKTMHIILENKTYNCTTDENGWITLNIDLLPGKYDVECRYYGSDSKENSFNKTTVTVLSTIEGSDSTKYYGESPYLTVKFFEGSGKLINNTNFIINVDGTNYVDTVDKTGVYYFTLNLNSGTHKITVTNPYDGLSAGYKLTVNPTIYVTTLVKVLGDGKQYVATLFDKNGDGLGNADVEVIINGVKYREKTDDFGEIRLNMEFAPKSYAVTVINPVTGEYVENTVNVLAPITENKDLSMYFSSGKYYKVRIIGAGGKVVGAGKTVKFKVNGVTYKVKTDKNGYARLQINLNPKKYVITAEYGGYKVSNKINVKPVLTAKNISKKSKKVTFKAKLVNAKGKALGGKKVTFKFKGKKYVAKTNSKGLAAIKLTLKVGKYKIYSIYGKSKIKNTITIKK